MTTQYDDKEIATLNELIEYCEDGAKGFKSAAEGVEDSGLRSLFRQYAAEREQFAAELQREVQALGGEPVNSGSVVGSFHRGWINLKAAITNKDEEAILVECERGEDAAKDAYEKAVNGMTLAGTVLPIIQRQMAKVLEAHNRVKALRDSETAVHSSSR